MKTLDNCSNFLGPIGEDIKQRIVTYFRKPTAENWDDIQSILISRGTTIWQAVIGVDPSFPKTGRRYTPDGTLIREWEKVPSPQAVLMAIRNLQEQKGGRG
jgi:hypothetical protein